MFCSAGELSCPSRKKAASADQNRSNAKSLPQIGSVEKTWCRRAPERLDGLPVRHGAAPGLAMKIGRTNKPEVKGYAGALAAPMMRDGCAR